GARDGLPGVGPDAYRQLDAALAAELIAQRRALLAHLRCRPDGPQRVVLVRDRDSEDRHHGVADVILDRPTVALDHVAHAAKPALHRPHSRLGVAPTPPP